VIVHELIGEVLHIDVERVGGIEDRDDRGIIQLLCLCSDAAAENQSAQRC
jgi:hypothetical protein